MIIERWQWHAKTIGESLHSLALASNRAAHSVHTRQTTCNLLSLFSIAPRQCQHKFQRLHAAARSAPCRRRFENYRFGSRMKSENENFIGASCAELIYALASHLQLIKLKKYVRHSRARTDVSLSKHCLSGGNNDDANAINALAHTLPRGRSVASAKQSRAATKENRTAKMISDTFIRVKSINFPSFAANRNHNAAAVVRRSIVI